MDYLEQVPKTGAFRFRRGIPLHLRPYFPDRGSQWREPLGTKDEAEARPRCHEIAAKVERLFQQAQARYEAESGVNEAPATVLSIEALTRLVADWKAKERSRRAQLVTVRPVMPGWSEFLHEAALTGTCNVKPRGEDPEAFMARMAAEQSYINAAIRDIGEAIGLRRCLRPSAVSGIPASTCRIYMKLTDWAPACREHSPARQLSRAFRGA